MFAKAASLALPICFARTSTVFSVILAMPPPMNENEGFSNGDTKGCQKDGTRFASSGVRRVMTFRILDSFSGVLASEPFGGGTGVVLAQCSWSTLRGRGCKVIALMLAGMPTANVAWHSKLDEPASARQCSGNRNPLRGDARLHPPASSNHAAGLNRHPGSAAGVWVPGCADPAEKPKVLNLGQQNTLKTPRQIRPPA